MTDEQFEIVRQQLDAILVLLSLTVPEDKAGKDLVIALDKADFPAKDIARLLGLTTNNVRVILHRAKKK